MTTCQSQDGNERAPPRDGPQAPRLNDSCSVFHNAKHATATVGGIGRCCRLWLGQAWVEDGRDATPPARPEPEGIVRIDRLPGAARGGTLAPRPSGVHHGEHAFHVASQIAARTLPTRDRWLHY